MRTDWKSKCADQKRVFGSVSLGEQYKLAKAVVKDGDQIEMDAFFKEHPFYENFRPSKKNGRYGG